MRRTPSALVLVALLAAGCSGASATYDPGSRAPVEHHQPTPEPYRDPPAATPYDGVTFQDPGVNPYVDPTRDRESTFGLDVDTASYGIARRFVADGNVPDPASVRVEEFVNSFDQGYDVPEDDDFAIVADGGPTPFLSPDEVLLRIGIQARDVSRHERPRAALTFVIDVSGSMARDDRLELVKQSLRLLVDALHRDDSVAIVVYGTDARVALDPTPASSRDAILRAIDTLNPEGSTNAEAGLRLGYRVASDQLIEGGINRVVLASDGVANVGSTDASSILQRVGRRIDSGIQLVAIGVGMGNYNDALLEKLADDGDGFYAYIDTVDEARKVFVEDLTGTIDTIALDARAQVEFDPRTVDAYRLIGYENRAIADHDFTNPDVPAGAIGAGHSVTALYALRLNEDAGTQDRIGTVRLRWKDPQSNRDADTSREIRVTNLAGSFNATDEHFKLDAVVAATAEVMRGSPWIDGYRLSDVVEVADGMSRELPRTDEVHDFLKMLDDAADLGH
ncbi:MAG: von Willebrand factor type A domain-containing protein [Chloroflexota bacterium]